MNIGVMSDTHDNIDKINKSINIFNDRGVEFVIHCGDVVSPFAAIPLKNLKCDYVGVFGNNDGDLLMINKVTSNRFYKMPKKIELNKKSIIIFHEPFIIDNIDEDVDFLLYGHTHIKDLRKKGEQIIINPGTVSGYLVGEANICIVNLSTKAVEFIGL
jgi:hypothetical protein